MDDSPLIVCAARRDAGLDGILPSVSFSTEGSLSENTASLQAHSHPLWRQSRFNSAHGRTRGVSLKGVKRSSAKQTNGQGASDQCFPVIHAQTNSIAIAKWSPPEPG